MKKKRHCIATGACYCMPLLLGFKPTKIGLSFFYTEAEIRKHSAWCKQMGVAAYLRRRKPK